MFSKDELMAITIIEMQKTYIKELEEKIDDLEKALENEYRPRKVKVKMCGRSKMDKNSHRCIR